MSRPRRTIHNPLGYYCPPNGATPDYVTEENLTRFVAWLCYDSSQGWATEIMAHADYKGFLMELHTEIIDLVEDALCRLESYLHDDSLDTEYATTQDLQGQYSISVPGERNADDELVSDYRFSMEFREIEGEDFVDVMIEAETVNYETGNCGDPRVSWLKVGIVKEHWYLDAIHELNSIREELHVLHKQHGCQTSKPRLTIVKGR